MRNADRLSSWRAFVWGGLRSVHRYRAGRQLINCLLLGTILLSAVAAAQSRTEIRDAIRGVSFVTQQLSDDLLSQLRIVAGEFAPDDRLAVGLSAMLFDDDQEPQDYVLWLRHEGRVWLSFPSEEPVSLTVDGANIDLDPLRQPQPFTGPDGRLLEKMEFRLDAADLARIGAGKDVRLRLSAESGTVEKRLSADETAAIASFAEPPGDPG